MQAFSQKSQILFKQCINQIKYSSNFTHTVPDDSFQTQNEYILKELYKTQYQKIKGQATPDGTKKYSERQNIEIGQGHFRTPIHQQNLKEKDKLHISSIGYGTYQGAPDFITDLQMFNALIESIQTGGVNVIDTANNFRYMKSERVIGAALEYLTQKLGYSRDEFFIMSKAGYLSEDGDIDHISQVIGKNLQEIRQSIEGDLIKEKKITEEDIITECFCMHPAYLEKSLEKSLNNMGLETLDLFYLQNSAEQVMSIKGEQSYIDKLKKAFEFLEKSRQKNLIKNYGLATWNCFRAKKEEEDIYLNLQKVHEIAKEVGGNNNGFNYIQVPINVMMPETFVEKWQEYKNEKNEIENMFLLKVARLLNINVVSSSPLMSGSLMQVPLPTDIFQCKNLGAKHLQFVRSIPAPSLLTTLIGQKTCRNTKMNLEVIQYSPLTQDEWFQFMTPKKREQLPEEAIEPE